ncbi:MULTISPECIES: hypothetical protein [unclassified Mesorhizobium]|uniref:hypothetical protein n=1 Tax=unclassified Mesorhizobium TaxID=325217 RepID=UPI00167890A7|nr:MULTISPECIES: hypothetical protein [unclassified Mesorhizobium]
MSKTVWVIMGNDYPAGVASSEANAEGKIAELKERDKRRGVRDGAVHWRTYEFTLDA